MEEREKEEKEENHPIQEHQRRRKKKLLDPATNKIRISSRKQIGFYVFLSKIFLNKYQEDGIELHALGRAI